jgi:hypothetical protein
MKIALAPIYTLLTGVFITVLSISSMATSDSARTEVPGTMGEVFAKQPWLSKQWEKLKVDLKVPINLEAGGVSWSWKYVGSSQPSFLKGTHQRLDAWSTTLSTNTGALGWTTGPVGVSGTLGANVIFSRIFGSQTQSIMQKPYTFWDRIPWRHEEVISLLRESDALRLEVYFDNGIYISDSSGNSGFGITRSRGLRFLVDIYRLKNNQVRLKLVGQRNDGNLGSSFNINPLDTFDYGTSGFLRRLLSKIFKCELFSHKTTNSSMENPPIDTDMFDYVFNLKNPEAAKAYDEVMQEIRDFKYLNLLNPLNKDSLVFKGRAQATQRVTEQLELLVQPADQVFRENRRNPPEERSVDRSFRAKARSALTGTSLSSKCLRLWNVEGLDSVSRTLIMNFDRADYVTYQIFENVLREKKTSFGLSNWGTVVRNSLNTLFKAELSDNNVFLPLELTDLTLTQDQREKDFTQKEFKSEVKDYLAYVLPPKVFKSIDWIPFERADSGAKTNVSLRYDIIFNQESFLAMEEYSQSQIEKQMRDYALNFPNAKWLETTPVDGINRTRGARWYDRFDYDIAQVSGPLEIILSKDPRHSLGDKAKAYATIRANPLFRQIGIGFLISMLPAESAADLMGFRLSMNGPNNLNITAKYGIEGETKTYLSVDYILRLISDRSFDLRLQSEATEVESIGKGAVSPANF